jgi:hypothetical protein
MQPKLLFLDFDGVLHPCTAGTFVYVDRFEAFMRKHPCVRVVLSTTWRIDHGWHDLLALFSADLRERFLGATPQLDDSLKCVREQEIHSWLRTNACQHLDWAALDDDESLFSPFCPQLVRCETIRGLRAAQLEQIERKLGLPRK